MKIPRDILKVGIGKFGFNARKIKDNLLNEAPLQQIQSLLDTLNPNRKRGKFTVQEDFEILSFVMEKKKSWFSLGQETMRGHSALRVRWTNILKPHIIKKSFELNLPFEDSLMEERKILNNIALTNRETESYIKRLPREWSEDDDKKLERLIRRMKISPKLLLEDFPGKMAGDIYQRYDQLFPNKAFSPHDDQKLKQLSGLTLQEVHQKFFPNHGPKTLYSRIKKLEKDISINSFLNQDQIDYLSYGISHSGRAFLYVLDQNKFPGMKTMDIIIAWTFYEPIDQMNAIWSKDRDIELVLRKCRHGKCGNSDVFAEFYAKELESRFYILSNSSGGELANRFKIGKSKFEKETKSE
jgi:hypothetical protein